MSEWGCEHPGARERQQALEAALDAVARDVGWDGALVVCAQRLGHGLRVRAEHDALVDERYQRQQSLMYPERYKHPFDVSRHNGSCGRCGLALSATVHQEAQA